MMKMLEPSKMTSKLFGNTTPRKNYCSNHKIPFSKHSGIMISNGWIEGEQIEEGSIPCPPDEADPPYSAVHRPTPIL